MQLTDLIQQSGGVGAIARELGLSESQAASGASALLPSILAGLQKSGGTAAGGGLGGLLGSLGGGGLLDQVLSPQPTNAGPGNELLGHIFGSKDDSRAVATQAASSTGIDASILKKMLPLLTMVVAGYLAKQGRAGGGTGGVLGGLAGALGGADGSAGGNPLSDLLGKLGR
jgi:hypothetical protein